MTAKITPETLRLALVGAEELQVVSVVNQNPTLMKFVAAIRSLVAHATEMDAVMKHKARPTTEGWYFWRWWCETSHGVPAQWSAWQVNWFSTETIETKDHSKNTLATRNFIGPFDPADFALTETPRPATTGERDGGEIK